MQGKVGLISEDNIHNNKNSANRRKRINRMKTVIVIIVILLMILPTISCIFLGIQVSRLQKQVNDLSSMHGLSELGYEGAKKENYAYAAEKSDMNLDTSELAFHALDTVNAASNLDILSQNQDLKIENQVISSEVNSDEADLGLNEVVSDANIVSEEQEFGTDKMKQRKDSSSTDIYLGKKVYLTFDDGPSRYTDDILDVLAEYNVKATFFVTGKTDKASKDQYRRIVEEGHTLGMHSFSHVYEKIYNSVEDFDKDFTKLWKLLYDTTGYKPSIFRFPGGSDNLVNKNGMEDFIRYLKDTSIVYFDWNVVSGDATGVEYTKEQLIDNVLNGVEMKRTSIVLMHDSQTKKTTVDSLPELLENLISEGAEILPLDNDIPPIQMIKADSIK